MILFRILLRRAKTTYHYYYLQIKYPDFKKTLPEKKLPFSRRVFQVSTKQLGVEHFATDKSTKNSFRTNLYLQQKANH